METNFLPFLCSSEAKTHLVFCQMCSKALVVIFIEHPQCTKHGVSNQGFIVFIMLLLRLKLLSVIKINEKKKTVVCLKIVDLWIFSLD